jgi:hypothetical protein
MNPDFSFGIIDSQAISKIKLFTPNSLFTIRYSPFPFRHSQFTIPSFSTPTRARRTSGRDSSG